MHNVWGRWRILSLYQLPVFDQLKATSSIYLFVQCIHPKKCEFFSSYTSYMHTPCIPTRILHTVQYSTECSTFYIKLFGMRYYTLLLHIFSSSHSNGFHFFGFFSVSWISTENAPLFLCHVYLIDYSMRRMELYAFAHAARIAIFNHAEN